MQIKFLQLNNDWASNIIFSYKKPQLLLLGKQHYRGTTQKKLQACKNLSKNWHFIIIHLFFDFFQFEYTFFSLVIIMRKYVFDSYKSEAAQRKSERFDSPRIHTANVVARQY